MLNKSTNAKNIILTIFLFPIALLFLLVLLITTPIDYFKYIRTRYYKDTHEKYSWLCRESYYIKFYDMIKKNNLAIDYYRSNLESFTGHGYFIYNDILILTDYEPCFDNEKNIWTVEIEDEYIDIKANVEETIEECNNFLKGDICKRAIVLIDNEVYSEHPNLKYDNFDFLPVTSGNELKALKTIIN